MAKGRRKHHLKCFWCEAQVEVEPYHTIAICSTCVGQGAKLPDMDLRNKAWQGDKPIEDILKTGMTFDL